MTSERMGPKEHLCNGRAVVPSAPLPNFVRAQPMSRRPISQTRSVPAELTGDRARALFFAIVRVATTVIGTDARDRRAWIEAAKSGVDASLTLAAGVVGGRCGHTLIVFPHVTCFGGAQETVGALVAPLTLSTVLHFASDNEERRDQQGLECDSHGAPNVFEALGARHGLWERRDRGLNWQLSETRRLDCRQRSPLRRRTGSSRRCCLACDPASPYQASR
jgi:hypothetical protein